MWHRRLGHRNYETIKTISSNQLVIGITINNCKYEMEYEACIKAKSNDTPFLKSAAFRATKSLQLIHSDVFGPIKTPTVGGKRYSITFIDHYFRFCIIYFMSKKSEAFEKLKEFISTAQNKFVKKQSP